jgi:hypothetical protein
MSNCFALNLGDKFLLSNLYRLWRLNCIIILILVLRGYQVVTPYNGPLFFNFGRVNRIHVFHIPVDSDLSLLLVEGDTALVHQLSEVLTARIQVLL